MRTLVTSLSDGSDDLNNQMIQGTIEPIAKALAQIEGSYPGSNPYCNFFCNGKYGPSRGNNLCATMPTK